MARGDMAGRLKLRIVIDTEAGPTSCRFRSGTFVGDRLQDASVGTKVLAGPSACTCTDVAAGRTA